MRHWLYLAAILAILAHVARPASAKQAVTYAQAAALYQYDASQPLSVVVKKIKKYPECVMLHIVYSSANGQRVPAVVFQPLRASRWHPVPGLILLHGTGGKKEDLVPFGHFLAATGYTSLIIDQYGCGERKKPGQQEISPVGILQTVLDVRRGIDYLQTRAHTNPNRIGVLGFSLGAIVGADAMGIDTRLLTGDFISAGGNIGPILRHMAPGAPLVSVSQTGQGTQIKIVASDIDPLTFASHISPRYVLMQNGTSDTIVPPSSSKALYHAIGSVPGSQVEITWCRSGNHVPLGTIYPQMRLWLNKNLRGNSVMEDTVSVSQ